MPTTSDSVIVIVVQDYGAHLISLIETAHVWIVDTEPNRITAEAIWKHPSKTRTGSLTTFKVPVNSIPEDAIASELYTIDLHHGEYSQSPPWHSIEVIGAKLTEEIRESLLELGVTLFEETKTGFIGYRN